MFVTPLGNFDGNSWDNIIQIIHKRKYMEVGYQPIKASPGDYGLEGFTKDGLAFQCYCPDYNVDSSKLYELQRDKITKDIKKLQTYSKELGSLLDEVKIKKWIFVTPRFSHHDLTEHCNEKKALVKSWNLTFIHGDFDVLIREAEDYSYEIGEYYNNITNKLKLSPKDSEVNSEKQVEWQKTEIDLVKNANEKNTIRINSLNSSVDLDRKINTLTDKNVRDCLNGESILRQWQNVQPENHQRFVELMAIVEEELIEKCLINEVKPNDFVVEILEYMELKVKNTFPYLDETTIMRLKNYAVSTWLLRCPLYFEMSSDEK